MLEKVKLALRLRSDTFDSQIEDLIAACAADLELAGVTHVDMLNPLVIRAAALYVKADFLEDEGKVRTVQRQYNQARMALVLFDAARRGAWHVPHRDD